MFVVRRAYRVNDSLPGESAGQPRWLWQRGGWLLVDRNTGRITQIKLPDFDPYYSDVSWYRDYAAYCGVDDDGERVSAIVAQITTQASRSTRSSSRSSLATFPKRCASRRSGSASPRALPLRRTAARSSRWTSTAALPT